MLMLPKAKAIVEREFRKFPFAASASIKVRWSKGRFSVWADGDTYLSVELSGKHVFECDTASPVEYPRPVDWPLTDR